MHRCLPSPRVARMAGGLAVLAVLSLLGSTSVPVLAGEGAPPEPGSPQARVREDLLLRRACDYLRLTRPQISLLILAARKTDERLALLNADEQRALKSLEPQAEKNPEYAEGMRRSLAQTREQLASQITTYAASQLVRLLTREQILLAWRLMQGDPPKYAHADPALLEASSGFGGGRRGQIQGATIFLRGILPEGEEGGVELQYLQRLADVEREAVVAERAPAEARSQAVQRLRLDLEGRLLDVEASPPAAVKRDRPFPQLVVETDDLNDLLQGVEPLARRLFNSPRWLSVLRTVPSYPPGPWAGVRIPIRTGSPRLVREYQPFQSFGDATRGGPALEPLGGSVRNGWYVFGPGQGVRLPGAGVTDHYAIDINLHYDGGGDGSYRKILDFKNGAKDIGLYFYQGHVTFYTLADGGAPVPGADHRLRIERDRRTRLVRAFLDFRPIFSFLDLDDEAVFEKGQALLFVDDKQTQGEQGPGALRSLLIWGPAVRRDEG